jgi:GGDEF domain-containing protein
MRLSAGASGGPLEHFKKHVYDEYGHDRGDAALRDAVSAMRRALRSFELI